MQETLVQFLGWEDPLEKGKATHSSILAWRIPWTISSTGSQRVDMTEQLSRVHRALPMDQCCAPTSSSGPQNTPPQEVLRETEEQGG